MKAKSKNARLEAALRKMFSAGESWATTYLTWFVPKKDEIEAKIKDAVRKAKRILRG